MKAVSRPGSARKTCLSELVLVSMFVASSSSFAQEQEKPKAEEQEEIIVVTGSRIATTSVAETVTPVAVIGSEEIKQSGNLNIDKVLGDSPQFVQATNGGATANTVPAGSAAGAA